MIERCLQLYMNKDEVVKTLLNRARIDPGFTTLGMYIKNEIVGDCNVLCICCFFEICFLIFIVTE